MAKAAEKAKKSSAIADKTRPKTQAAPAPAQAPTAKPVKITGAVVKILPKVKTTLAEKMSDSTSLV